MNAIKLLIQANLKATHQRIEILNVVLNCKNHPSTDDLYALVQKQIPSISLATVYKTLETFVNSGLISKTLTTEGQLRFDPNLASHGHIYSNNSNEIIDYFDEDLNEVISNFFKEKKVKNFHIKKISLNIIGDKIDQEKPIIIQ
jgi:Fur family peroxide stress response transcriptional regulator